MFQELFHKLKCVFSETHVKAFLEILCPVNLPWIFRNSSKDFARDTQEFLQNFSKNSCRNYSRLLGRSFSFSVILQPNEVLLLMVGITAIKITITYSDGFSRNSFQQMFGKSFKDMSTFFQKFLPKQFQGFFWKFLIQTNFLANWEFLEWLIRDFFLPGLHLTISHRLLHMFLQEFY